MSVSVSPAGSTKLMGLMPLEAQHRFPSIVKHVHFVSAGDASGGAYIATWTVIPASSRDPHHYVLIDADMCANVANAKYANIDTEIQYWEDLYKSLTGSVYFTLASFDIPVGNGYNVNASSPQFRRRVYLGRGDTSANAKTLRFVHSANEDGKTYQGRATLYGFLQDPYDIKYYNGIILPGFMHIPI